MKYILLLIFYQGASHYPTTVMHDFDSKESCVAALREVRQAYANEQAEYLKYGLRKSICMPK